MPKRPLLVLVPVLLVLAGALRGQDGQLLNGPESDRLLVQISNLMEVAGILLPEMARAGAPLRENFRQGITTLESLPVRNHSGTLYRMLTNAKAFLHLVDTLPRPKAFAEDLDQQLLALRSGTQRLEAHFRAILEQRESQALGSDRDNLARYAEENTLAATPVEGAPERVVFLGDSITDSWELNQYFTDRGYLNRGISGQTTGQMLGRTKPDALDLKPRVVVVLGGTNDLARGVPDATIRHNLEAIGMLAQSAGAVPVLASILPVSDHHAGTNPRFRRTTLRKPSRIWDLNTWMSNLCRTRNWVYLDYFTALADENGRLRSDLSDDGLHPNTEGYKIMAPLAQAAIDSARNQRPRRRGRFFR